ncbi:hypothetical protein ANAEL_00732 [Anaerolineales bacterium]|nr:hypothetical protein ANAEL_00732 [Anaerolineales bacterium]
MKNSFVSLAFFVQKVDRQHVQLALVILSLVAVILGTGAPTDGGGVGR